MKFSYSHPRFRRRDTILLLISIALLAGSCALLIAARQTADRSIPLTTPVQGGAAIVVEEPSAPGGNMLVTECDGRVCVYLDGELYLMTNTPVASRPAQDREQLARGIVVETQQELHQILEDFGA